MEKVQFEKKYRLKRVKTVQLFISENIDAIESNRIETFVKTYFDWKGLRSIVFCLNASRASNQRLIMLLISINKNANLNFVAIKMVQRQKHMLLRACLVRVHRLSQVTSSAAYV